MQFDELIKNYWNDKNCPQMNNILGMGGGGICESAYRHFFEVKYLKEIVTFTSDKTVLELGCGSGRWILAIAPLVKHYVGVDYSKIALEKATKSIIEKGIKNVDLVEQSVLEYKNNDKFDIIYISGISLYFDDNDLCKLINNLKFLLKDNGVIIERTTVVEYDLEIINDNNYYAIYRTSNELKTIFSKCDFLRKRKTATAGGMIKKAL